MRIRGNCEFGGIWLRDCGRVIDVFEGLHRDVLNRGLSGQSLLHSSRQTDQN